MQIPYSELEDEVKDGYYVDAMMKCCWASSEEVLAQIDRICRKYDIQYFAEWGTLLGTVRHGGPIPWDDDMDITMKRPDYNKFLKVAPKELPERYHILNYRNDADYWDVMSRVVNSEHIIFRSDFLGKNHLFPYSAGVDIFPMDFLPTKEGEAEILKQMIDAVKGVADSYIMGYTKEDELEGQLQFLETLCGVKIKREGNIQEHLYDIVVSLYALYNEDESDEIALMPLWVDGKAQVYPKSYFQEAVRLPFGRSTIPVPIAYDAILKRKYGDYMKMVRRGGSHDYPYYKKQEKELNDEGIWLLTFKYEDRTEKIIEKNVKTVTMDLEQLDIFEKAHEGILKVLALHENDMAMQLLSKCQEIAINTGENIEKTIVDNEEIIHALEEYCELAFQIHEMINQGETMNPEAVYNILTEQLSVIKDLYKKEYQYKKKVVFIIDKASRWKSLEGYWKVAKADKNCTVTVAAVPYFYKTIMGEVLEKHYEKDLLPEYLEAIDCTQYDFKAEHPDVIFINSPYDGYNYIMDTYDYFYSANLVNLTDKLVYVPWFTTSEITREDERGWQSMQYFVTMPGVVNADKVILPSESVRQTYIDYLTDWAGEDTRSIWEEKISSKGAEFIDLTEDDTQIEQLIPDIWKAVTHKEDGSRKKIMLYSISSTGFAEYGEKAVEKLNSVLDTFKENKDAITLLWYPNAAIETSLKTYHPQLWDEYKKIVKQYRSENWGIYAEGFEADKAVEISDAYYGDACTLSQNMVIAKKPVMLQNFECM